MNWGHIRIIYQHVRTQGRISEEMKDKKEKRREEKIGEGKEE
jgi:hypothetical protein